MPDGVFELSVLTPEATLLQTDARAIVLRSSDGDLTVLDGHTPIVTDVVPGDVRVDPPGGDPVHLAVHGGYLQVETGPGVGAAEGSARGTRVTMLAGVAELATSIDVARAERARAEAEARLEALRAAAGRSGEDAGTGDLEIAEAEDARRRADVRLRVAGR